MNLSEFRFKAPSREERAAARVEFRAKADGGVTVEGYACVFDEPYEMWDWLGPFNEVVDQGAFTKSLAENDDVRLLLNHEGMPLARTKSGTLTLSQDDVGLRCLAELEPGDPDVASIVPKMRRGDLDEMSFAFRVTKQQWSPDFTERHIKEVKLYDVSLVTFPANPATSAWLRMEQLAADLGRLDDRALAEIRSGAGDRTELVEAIRAQLNRVQPAAREDPQPATTTTGSSDEGNGAAEPTISVPLTLARAQADALRLRCT